LTYTRIVNTGVMFIPYDNFGCLLKLVRVRIAWHLL